MKTFLSFLVFCLFFATFTSFAEIRDPVFYDTKNSSKPNITSLLFVPSQITEQEKDNKRINYSNYNTIVATLKFPSSCEASKYDVIALNFSTGAGKEVQAYLLMLVDQQPLKTCGELPMDVQDELLLYRKFKVAIIPKNITKASVNGLMVNLEHVNDK